MDSNQKTLQAINPVVKITPLLSSGLPVVRVFD